jgi:hypothetical protein
MSRKRKREPRDRRARPEFGKIVWRDRPGKDDVSLKRIIHALRPDEVERVRGSLVSVPEFKWTDVEILQTMPATAGMAGAVERYDVTTTWLRDMFTRLEFKEDVADACIETVRVAATGGVDAMLHAALQVWNQAQVTAVQARAAAAREKPASRSDAADADDDDDAERTAEMVKRVLREF